VRLIGANSEQLGIVSMNEALAQARAIGLDLCEIASNAKPPVCKLMDFGKYRYEQQKKLKEAKKKQKVVQTKEVKFSPNINEHDFLLKINQATRFLEEGDKVKTTLMFRGRQAAHPERGYGVMGRVVAMLKEKSHIDREPKQEGNQLFAIFSPLH